MAAVIAFVHLSFWPTAGRRLPSATAVTLVSAGAPPQSAAASRPQVRQSAAKPKRIFCIGLLSLMSGMAVVTLAHWLHILHVSTTLG